MKTSTQMEMYLQLSSCMIGPWMVSVKQQMVVSLSLMEYARKGKFYIENNGKIQFTYQEAEKKHNISRSAFRSAIDQLVNVGFIDIAQPGSGLHRDVTLYGISERWRQYGTKDFVEMKRPKRKQRYGFTTGNRLGKNTNKEKDNIGL